MRTGAILLRVSTQKQAADDKTSYTVQRDACLAYAAKNDIVVPDDLIWQEVGKRDQYWVRDGLQAALTAAEQGRYQALIVWRLDRLTDDIGNFIRILDRLKQHGALPWSASEPDVDLSTPDGLWFVHTKLHWQVAPERRTTATRTSANRKQYTLEGRPWASHSPRYGYKWVVDPSRTRRIGDVLIPLKERLEPDPLTAPVVQQMYAWVAEGKSLNWIARALSGVEDDGKWRKPTPRQHSGVSGANPNSEWREEAIVKMLHFPGYMGRWPAYRTKRTPRNDDSEGHRQVALDESEWVWVEPSPAPALVDAALWHQAQQRLTNNKQYAARNARTEPDPELALLYSGMARCGACDGRMNIKRGTRADGTPYARYQCEANARSIAKCPGVGYACNAQPLDAAVWEALVRILREPESLTRIARRLQTLVTDDGVTVITPVDRYNALTKKLTDKERELANLTLRSANVPAGDPGALGYDLAISALGAEVKTLREDVTQAKRDADKYQRVEQVLIEWEEYLEAAQDTVDLAAAGYHSPAVRRQWLEDLGAKVVVTPRTADLDRTAEAPIATLKLTLTIDGIGARLPTSDDATPLLAVPVLRVAQPRMPWTDAQRATYRLKLESAVIAELHQQEQFGAWTPEEGQVYEAECLAAGSILPPEEWIAEYRRRPTAPDGATPARTEKRSLA